MCRIVESAIPAYHRVKIKGNETRDKYLDQAREQKKLWNMWVTVIPIIIGTLGTVPKGLVKGLQVLEIGGQTETRILRKVQEILEDLQ